MADVTFKDLREGETVRHAYVISPRVYEAFLQASGDTNPLHVDDAFARRHGFEGKVMHGAILNGFVSELVGVRLPGDRALLQSVTLEYRGPSYLGDEISIEGTVKEKIESVQVVIIGLRLFNVTRNRLVATGRAQVGFTS